MYAQIAVGGKMRLLLHYDVPPDLLAQLTPGHLVRVPLRSEERLVDVPRAVRFVLPRADGQRFIR